MVEPRRSRSLNLWLRFSKQRPNCDYGGAEEVLLQLLLFVDRRPSSKEQVREIKLYLQSLRSDYSFELDVIEIDKQPHLVEFYKLVATPALVKMAPAPQQTIAGGNLIQELKKWWPQWKGEDKISTLKDNADLKESVSTTARSGKDIRLSDEIFRLRQEKEELEAQIRFKDKILAMLAHDLRTPLTAASIAVDTIEISEKNSKLSPNKLADLKRKLLKQAKNQFKIMNNMIGELLQNSQNEDAKLAVRPKPLAIGSLFEEIVAQFDAKLQRKSMELVLDVPQDLPLVYADAELIRQLVNNLLDNAIKYTPAQGQISLSVLHRTNQKVEVSVCDNGPGIPDSKQEQIFEGNFRLQRDRELEGYGLGLATCRQIVLAHYGQIWVDSAPKSGSCFRFTLLVYK